MRTVHFKQVDVFTTRPFFGNPVAVVLDAQGLADAEMARIAAWTNLSETTFVLPSARASYRLRIFTPRSELTFAGHPTIGSAHAVVEAGLVAGDGPLVQECGAGLVPLSLGADGSISARWIVADVGSIEMLRRLKPDLDAMTELNRRTDTTGVTAYAVDGAQVEVRSFAPLHGIAEDPVCGSGNASVGAYLHATGGLARFPGGRYLARQGAAVGRAGEIQVSVDATGAGAPEIRIGGAAVTVIEGTIRLA